jgi:hypothetical protein
MLTIACKKNSTPTEGKNDVESADSIPCLKREKADSIKFRLTHHYTINHNFIVKSDSLTLTSRISALPNDTFVVRKGERIVVADIYENVNDSAKTVWIKMARDQHTMGWIRENDMLTHVVPDNIISYTLDILTNSRTLWMFSILAFGVGAFFFRRYRSSKLQILKFDEMDSFYPVLFLILTATLSCLYTSIQRFVPEYWQEYYFNPTLNPLQLPAALSLLVALVWTTIIIFIAVLDNIYNNFYIAPGITYLCELLGLGMLTYLFFSWTTIITIGYFLLPVFIVALLYIYFKYIRCKYTCGECGCRMHSPGRCIYCGTYNHKD